MAKATVNYHGNTNMPKTSHIIPHSKQSIFTDLLITLRQVNAYSIENHRHVDRAPAFRSKLLPLFGWRKCCLLPLYRTSFWGAKITETGRAHCTMNTFWGAKWLKQDVRIALWTHFEVQNDWNKTCALHYEHILRCKITETGRAHCTMNTFWGAK